jgi:hypothetical protein
LGSAKYGLAARNEPLAAVLHPVCKDRVFGVFLGGPTSRELSACSDVKCARPTTIRRRAILRINALFHVPPLEARFSPIPDKRTPHNHSQAKNQDDVEEYQYWRRHWHRIYTVRATMGRLPSIRQCTLVSSPKLGGCFSTVSIAGAGELPPRESPSPPIAVQRIVRVNSPPRPSVRRCST